MDGFLIYDPMRMILHPLESSGTDSIEHVIASYDSLPLHAAVKVKAGSITGQVAFKGISQ